MIKLTKVKIFNTIKHITLPLLVAVYPAVFLYGNNVSMVSNSSLIRTVLFYSLLALLISSIFLIIFRGQTLRSANAAFTFLVFFNLYGILYGFLIAKDMFHVEHYTLLPFFLLLTIYASLFVAQKGHVNFWSTAVVIMALLIFFNLIKILPSGIEKKQIKDQAEVPSSPVIPSAASKNYPDVYYIIFDEFAGFDTVRSYWNYQGVDDFVEFVRSRGFFVAENSRGSGNNTLHQMVERLNYKEYPNLKANDKNVYEPDIVDSRTVRNLKSLGYSTVTFNELVNQDFILPLEVDYSFGYETTEEVELGSLFDPFGVLVADNTMLRAFSEHYKVLDPVLEKRKKWIVFTADKVARLDEIPSPRFVYVHFSMPHFPFIFDENGKPVDRRFHHNWNYYLGYYKYAITIAERMIDNILTNADPNRLPVIVIQSDHGARNGLAPWDSEAVILEDYPEGYGNHILNIMFLPGFDTSQLPQDINPINTFPIIFNHYFGTDIPLIE